MPSAANRFDGVWQEFNNETVKIFSTLKGQLVSWSYTSSENLSLETNATFKSLLSKMSLIFKVARIFRYRTLGQCQ